MVDIHTPRPSASAHTSLGHVFLARHGRTILNAESRLRGLADPPLDDVGQLQATQLGAQLSGAGILRILSSPLQRARQTATAVASVLGLDVDVDVDVDPRLNDRDYGPWTGHLKSEVTAQWGSADRAPGVEPVESVLSRVWPLFEELQEESMPTILVTHDAVIRPILARILHEEPREETPTGCWNELLSTNGEWRVLSLNTSTL